jgi:hypothetical protein
VTINLSVSSFPDSFVRQGRTKKPLNADGSLAGREGDASVTSELPSACCFSWAVMVVWSKKGGVGI